MRRSLTTLICACILGLAACGSDDEQESAAAPAPTETPTETPAPTEAPAEAPANVQALAEEISTDLEEKPTIPRPEGEPPAELVVEDIVEGDGEPLAAGDQVSVQYVGASWSTGKEFDASWDRGEPFTFPLGGGSVIGGWDEGVQGLKAGGRRMLVIPPALGYGPQGAPPDIAPNETLVFVIDATKAG